ncbi:hypothetical protein CYLTODRAFT_440164 [Cylindrobasidium torrendii FP15055 ss-10]|uniref:SNF2 family DNA-dependent ATPase n=1 Tax=Cylindrobasidium torrendii FP15055 ss-10 TaxID=1314674 RepID=A0A0D7BRP8_9AGAR|nr:hypothetical protein CYLTODRAFT_440164 [Cylindrobasidium torrendii FP15055 ss-10]
MSTAASSPVSVTSELPESTLAASSPPRTDASEFGDDHDDDTEEENKDTSLSGKAVLMDKEHKYSELTHLLQKSQAYSSIMWDLIEETRRKRSEPSTERVTGGKRTASDARDAPKSKKRKLDDGQAGSVDESDTLPVFSQPKLVTGATLKPYQLEGLQWLTCLHSNGISGILADEMGLGKTLQTIAFSAYLRENNYSAAFLVVCPLSVLHNWVEEYAKFAPTIPVCMYHGTPDERAELRRTAFQDIPKSTQANTIVKDADPDETYRPPAKRGRRGKKGGGSNSRRPPNRGTKAKKPPVDMEETGKTDEEPAKPPTFPVVVTTYEIIMKDRAHLAGYKWGYIVVDEGHRLKNLDSILMREIKKYNNASRMILTGTPLHNNLSELWALLNFVLPDIFTDVEQFQKWFDIPSMKKTIGKERAGEIIDTLHAILKPFLLRRMKTDVEINLPPKKEYVLYAPLSTSQHTTYSRIIDGTLRAHLIGQESKPSENPSTKNKKVTNEPRTLRSRKAVDHTLALEDDDDVYFDRLENGEADEGHSSSALFDVNAANKQREYDAAAKKVNNMKLQNTVMQLRKVCSHPYLFDWPVDTRTREPVLDKRIVSCSGKMMVLEQLLDALFKDGHKVLIFSQFTTMLDIIDDWAREMKGWDLCRIDGSTPHMTRKEEMQRFQNGGDAPDAPCLFLLSTRAGGLGINLTAADTVIFYDQDWNPQIDAQAQDRAHRIGQTRPVLVFRLVSAHTIETKVMEKAAEKKKLEALVIAKGKFKAPIDAKRRGKPSNISDLAADLLRLDGEKINIVQETSADAGVISPAALAALLDRSPEVFTERQMGWTSCKSEGDSSGKRPTFEVFRGMKNMDGDVLASLLTHPEMDDES